MALLATILLVGTGATALAQPYPGEPPPPPEYYAPPPPSPPRYYAPPPRYYAPPPRYYAPPRPVRYYRLPPPWIRAPRVRGTFGFSGFGSIVARQDGGVEYIHSGGGFAFFGGVEIGRVVGIEAKYSASFHNPVDDCTAGFAYAWCNTSYLLLQTVGVDLKLHIPTNTRFVPYFAVGPLVGWIGRQGYLTDATGGGFEAGGGFDVWISRHGTIGVEALYRGLRMSDYGTFTGTDTFISLVQVGATIAAHF